MAKPALWVAMLVLVMPVIGGCLSLHATKPIDDDDAGWETARARNVILFIGDGMGVSTVTAGRIYDGQSRGESGEENLLSFERFPHTALVKTYNSNQQVPDSAGTASAMNTGVKTRAGVIGIGPQAYRGDCDSALSHRLPTIAESLIPRAKAIGIVSTARLTHATPAAVFAHVPERDWENDSAIPEVEWAKGCRDIALQLIDFPFTLALGGGHREFFGQRGGGRRRDAHEDLPMRWRERTGGMYVTDRSAMASALRQDRPVLGVFAESHLTYMLDRTESTVEPTLSEMTRAAIDRLARHPGGYFLMIEAGKIDLAHHEGKAAYALSEVQELANAVEIARSSVDLSDTLILVTADHSHTLTMGGYPTRGNPILGLVTGNDGRGIARGAPNLADDGHPYTTLAYSNGPGAVLALPRTAPSIDGVSMQQSLIPLKDETHGGEDVPLYAIGAGSHRVHGVIEQNRIHDIIMTALGQ